MRRPDRLRERSVDDSYERRYSGGRTYEDDVVISRETRRRYDDDPPYPRRSPPPAEIDRRISIEKERREFTRSPSPPPRRPAPLLRHQSSLDTFDRRPRGPYEGEEYAPPPRRDGLRPQAYAPIPLPRDRALPPPRRYAEREAYEEIRISDPDYYGDGEFRSYPERVRARETIRTRRNSAGSARSRSRTSISSSSSAGGSTAKSQYPKKGKTRIPARLVSTRALFELGYPFVREVSVPKRCASCRAKTDNKQGEYHNRAKGPGPAEY
jgi:hypothetical protein